MEGPAMSTPAPGFVSNPSKEITVEPYDRRVTVMADGAIIANTDRALVLSETPYPPVIYIPFDDIDFSRLEKTAHTTHCPYKGDASYWSVGALGESGANAMWAYEAPYDEVEEIRDHGAFYRNKVTIETE
jgi:uncharacterized protein (DUF427 family)